MVTQPLWNQEYDQSYPMRSNPVYVAHINRGLNHTHIARGEYCNVVLDHSIDHISFESKKCRYSFFKRITLNKPPSVYTIPIRRTISGVSYKLRDIDTISWRLRNIAVNWRLGYIAANVREFYDMKIKVVNSRLMFPLFYVVSFLL